MYLVVHYKSIGTIVGIVGIIAWRAEPFIRLNFGLIKSCEIVNLSHKCNKATVVMEILWKRQ
jgi:hypothetical protein